MSFVLNVPQITLPVLSKSSSAAATVATAAAAASRFPVNRIYCIGRNYREHAFEMGHDPDREPPFFFQKPTDAVVETCAAGGGVNLGVDGGRVGERSSCVIPYPPMTSSLHYEAELVVAIGKGGFNIKVENAKKHIFGYAIGCDLTRRDLQAEAKKLKRPWATAKGFDYSAPIGAIVPVEAEKEGEKELFSNSLLFPLLKEDSSIRLLVNGEIRQNSTIDKMIWSIPEIISYLSNYFRLKPGDLIMTGTPAGVDELNVGDEVEIQCGGLPTCSFSVGEAEKS